MAELILDSRNYRAAFVRHSGGGGPEVVVGQLGTAGRDNGLLVGSAKAFVVDRPAVFVQE